jgi:hypothetical protein
MPSPSWAPINAGCVLGASSDHLVLDLTDANPPLKVGDGLAFRITYGAMLAVMTSEYVEKVPVKEVSEIQTRKSVSFVVDPCCGDPFAGASLHSI